MKLSPRVLPGALHAQNKGACDWYVTGRRDDFQMPIVKVLLPLHLNGGLILLFFILNLILLYSIFFSGFHGKVYLK